MVSFNCSALDRYCSMLLIRFSLTDTTFLLGEPASELGGLLLEPNVFEPGLFKQFQETNERSSGKYEEIIGTRAACAVKKSKTDRNIEKQITYFIVIWLIFGLILAMFIKSQTYQFDVIAHKGHRTLTWGRMTRNFCMVISA